MDTIRLTSENAHHYIGYNVSFINKKKTIIKKILGYTTTSIKIDCPDLNNCATFTRKIMVILSERTQRTQTNTTNPNEPKVTKYRTRMAEAKTDTELVKAKAQMVDATAEGRVRLNQINETEDVISELKEQIKKAKHELKVLKYEREIAIQPTADEFKKIQDDKIKAMMASGDVEGIMALFAKQTAKAKKVVI